MSILSGGGESGIPVVGRVKTGMPGAPRQDGKQAPPIKFDHFELTGLEREGTASDSPLITDLPLMRVVVDQLLELQKLPHMAHVKLLCGKECKRAQDLGFKNGLPTVLLIRMFTDDVELSLPHRLGYFRTRTAYCTSSTGEVGMRLEEKGTKKVGRGRNQREVRVYGERKQHTPCLSGDCPDFIERRCKLDAKFRFLLDAQAWVGGCYEWRTTSWNSARNLRSSLLFVKQQAGGVLAQIPLLLMGGWQQVQPRGGGAPGKAFILRVSFPGSPQQLIEEAAKTLQLRAPQLAEVRKLEAQIRHDDDWNDAPAEIAAHVAEFPPGDAPGDDQVEPEPAPGEPGDQVDEPAPGDDQVEGDDFEPMTDDDRQQVIDAAFGRMEALGLGDEHATNVVKSIIRGMGYDTSQNVDRSQVPDLVKFVQEWAPDAEWLRANAPANPNEQLLQAADARARALELDSPDAGASILRTAKELVADKLGTKLDELNVEVAYDAIFAEIARFELEPVETQGDLL